MNFRRITAGFFGLVVLAALAACGGPGTNGPEGLAPQDWDEEDLPQWIRDLPEGTEPREDEHTQEAILHMLRAQGREGDELEEILHQALEAAEAAIEADPENPQGYFLAGEIHMGLGNLEEAAEMFDRAEEIYPRYVLETEAIREQAWIDEYNEGIEFVQEGDLQGALEYFERAHMIYQGRPDAMIQLASIYTEMDRRDEAIDLYRQASELIQGPRREGMDEEILEAWEEHLLIARFNRAQLLFEAERYLEAAELFEEVLADDPDDMTALTNMAVALTAAGEDERARELFDDLLARPDLGARDYYAVGVGLYQADEFGEAARAFAQTLEVIPGHRDALFNRVQSLFLAEQWEEVIEAGDLLLELDSHNRAAHQFVAQGLVRLGEEHEAVRIMERMEDLPFEVDGLQMEATRNGVAVLGHVVNMNMQPGRDVQLRIHFYTVEGAEAGTTDVTVTLGDTGEAVAFQADLRTGEEIFGFRYEVLG